MWAFTRCLLIGCGIQFGIWGNREASAQANTNSVPESSVAGGTAEQRQDTAEPRSSNGNELGSQPILRRRSRPRMFQVYSDTQYLYDSNVLLADGEFIKKGDDSVFIQDLGASFSPRLVEPLVSSLYYHHNLVRFDDFSQFDFDADTGGLHLGLPVADLFNLYGDLSAGRYYYRHGGHEFYKYFNMELGIGREQRITRRASLIYGYQLDWRPSTPSDLTRIDNAGYLGANFALIDKLTAQFFYRIRIREYYQGSRTDLDNLLNLTLVYSFNDYISLRVFAAYGVNTSSKTTHDYDVFNGGSGLNLTLKF